MSNEDEGREITGAELVGMIEELSGEKVEMIELYNGPAHLTPDLATLRQRFVAIAVGSLQALAPEVWHRHQDLAEALADLPDGPAADLARHRAESMALAVVEAVVGKVVAAAQPVAEPSAN